MKLLQNHREGSSERLCEDRIWKQCSPSLILPNLNEGVLRMFFSISRKFRRLVYERMRMRWVINTLLSCD